jgi:hypothetical protein
VLTSAILANKQRFPGVFQDRRLKPLGHCSKSLLTVLYIILAELKTQNVPVIVPTPDTFRRISGYIYTLPSSQAKWDMKGGEMSVARLFQGFRDGLTGF